MHSSRDPHRRPRPMLAAISSAILLVAACSESPLEPEPPAEAEPAAASAALIAFSTPPFVGCTGGDLDGGALYEICFPAAWNGDVVFWAHGYVAPDEPLAIPDDEIDGTPIAEILTGLGYGFATTSYRRNGLAADVAVADLETLAERVNSIASPRFRLLAGASEGSLSTALALEQPSSRFDGGLAVCGPVGSFRGQVNHFGDFRTIFDYFFPGVLPGDATTAPQEVRDQWNDFYVPLIFQQLEANPTQTAQLLSVTRAQVDPADPSTVGETVTGLLWYSVFGADDAVARLGGNPFDNRFRFYRGSSNDLWLNLRVKRYRASPAALEALSAFETTGRLRHPVQSLHTTGDPIIPFWHQPVYHGKVLFAGAGSQLISLPVDRYGHCTVTMNEALTSFALLVLRVTGQNLIASASTFPSVTTRREFLSLARREGAAPVVVEDDVWRAWTQATPRSH